MAKGDHVLLRRMVRDAAGYEAASAVAALRSLALAATHSPDTTPAACTTQRPNGAA